MKEGMFIYYGNTKLLIYEITEKTITVIFPRDHKCAYEKVNINITDIVITKKDNDFIYSIKTI